MTTTTPTADKILEASQLDAAIQRAGVTGRVHVHIANQLGDTYLSLSSAKILDINDSLLTLSIR